LHLINKLIGATLGCEAGLIEEPEARAWRFVNGEPAGTLKQQDER
jgi:hypothetical protein